MSTENDSCLKPKQNNYSWTTSNYHKKTLNIKITKDNKTNK